MPGTLYICATPIGNLGDITERVINTLRSVDFIAAEDTRNSMKLMTHFDIHVPMVSYHEYNKYDKAEELTLLLQSGKDVALITDAGTPAVSDPGEVLVKMCIDEGIQVTSLPGACAAVTALTLSGLKTGRFSFDGFLPKEKKQRAEILKDLKDEKRTIILYESPHHLLRTLSDLIEVLGDRKIALCRELTKVHEEIIRTTLSGALSYYENKDPRGEYVLILEGGKGRDDTDEEKRMLNSLSIREHVEAYEKKGMDRKSAMKAAAADRGVSKRDIYSALLEE